MLGPNSLWRHRVGLVDLADGESKIDARQSLCVFRPVDRKDDVILRRHALPLVSEVISIDPLAHAKGFAEAWCVDGLAAALRPHDDDALCHVILSALLRAAR